MNSREQAEEENMEFYRKSKEGLRQKANLPLIISGMTLLISIAVMAMVSYVAVVTNTVAETDAVCIKCELLDEQATDVKLVLQDLMTVVGEGDKRKCCVHTREELQAVLLLGLAQNRPLDTAPFTEFASHPLNGAAAHKRLHWPTERETAADGTPVMAPLLLKPEDSRDEVAKNLIVTPHGIVILHTGLYQISLEITFGGSQDNCCSNNTTWHYSVMMSRPNNRKQSGSILYAPHICCDDCPSELKTTVGTFHLQAGDHLHVEVSAKNAACQFDKIASFFGVFMMGTT